MVFQKGNPLRRVRRTRRSTGSGGDGTIKKLQSAYLARAGAPDLK